MSRIFGRNMLNNCEEKNLIFVTKGWSEVLISFREAVHFCLNFLRYNLKFSGEWRVCRILEILKQQILHFGCFWLIWESLAGARLKKFVSCHEPIKMVRTRLRSGTY